MSVSNVLERQVGRKLVARHRTLAVAESCTGGLIAHRITNVPGSSDYFLGGVVAYSNRSKSALLGVRAAYLAQFGAVNEMVARKMAEGVRERFEADCGVAVTGIAGPGGGSAEKPVGLVFIALATERGTEAARCLFRGTRDKVKQQTADAALKMLLEVLS